MDTLNKYQTTWKRWLASMIDGVLFMPLALAADYFEISSNTTAFFLFTISHVLLFTLYLVIGHGHFGQTLGKYVMGIKVLNVQETGTIGYWRAFLRDSVWFFAQTAGIVFIIINTQGSPEPVTNYGSFNMITDLITLSWFLLEVITMLLNKKRRAMHDLIAGSVVVDLGVIRREQLYKKHRDLMQEIRVGV